MLGIRMLSTVLRAALSKVRNQDSPVIQGCLLHTTQNLKNEELEDVEEEGEGDQVTIGMNKGQKVPVVDVDTSIRYMNSNAYKITYAGAKVWEPYRRNHKGRLPPKKTRKMCIRAGIMETGNPCPICRDEYLVVHYKNAGLLEQFISPQTGEVIDFSRTGVCQKAHGSLLIAVQQAWDKGLLEKPLEFREYDYEHYYPHLRKSQKAQEQSS